MGIQRKSVGSIRQNRDIMETHGTLAGKNGDCMVI